MEILSFLVDTAAFFIDLLLHLDRHLVELLAEYGVWLYAILFLIVFCETGLVVTPFLPGDSLLFMAGALAAGGGLDPLWLIVLLFAAAVLGDTLNYTIGKHFGRRMEHWENSRFFNRRALERTQAFYARHGGKTIVIARFMPIIRTFAPFVAGMARMEYRRFVSFNVVGAALWVAPLTMLGYWFGNLPVVKSNLSLVVIGIVVLSLMPMLVAWWRERSAVARGGI
ncbi:DedA family protein [Pseudothauera rhizosphaerae]|uniref:DedA family protein n=1 Tax=Pseudothauera rhizosphaerae TaxID=2565932 RepID=A0A4S4AIM7_9RHOO|nr:DedA family protein [Pseudothauera rhizosphaerae]THF59216.1 DedA family protein [Pseudothauera rhizosphaerae]